MAAADSGSAISSLVKYDVPSLVEKARKGGADAGSGATETQDMLNSILPPRYVAAAARLAAREGAAMRVWTAASGRRRGSCGCST